MKTCSRMIAPALMLLCLTVGGVCVAQVSSADTSGGTRPITLPHFEPMMPAAPGRATFMVACVSCHSPRYIVMQPPLSRHQWEGVVDKMVKIYNAPLDTNQVGQTVDYLVAITAPTFNDQAEDSFSPSDSTSSPQQLENIPQFAVAADPQENAMDIKRGAAAFVRDCAGCHGQTGQGDGIVSHVLLPKPADLAAAQFSTKLLSRVLWNGVPGTSMPSWRSLPKSDLIGLVSYVQSLHPIVPPEPAAPESLARGRTLFLQLCASCHGVQGDAKSPAALALAPAPTNFRLEQPDASYVLKVLDEGISGTAMPSWKKQLSESDCLALASFVSTFYLAYDKKE
jgi:cbb3-type cytochrome c oxidase subunit III